MDETPVDARARTMPPMDRAEAAELLRMARRILDVGALSEFVLALRDEMRRQAGAIERP